MKFVLIGMLTLLMTSLANDAVAAIQHSNNLETLETQKENSVLKTVKRHFESAKKFTSRKIRQLRKQYNEMSSVKKVGWGIGMIIIGALVIIGSIFSLAPWGFVIGLGLIIFGALKIVIGVLGVVI